MNWIKLESVDQLPKDGTKFLVYYKNPNDAFDFTHKRKAPYNAINLMGFNDDIDEFTDDDWYFTYFHESNFSSKQVIDRFSHICFVEEPEGIDWKPNFTINLCPDKKVKTKKKKRYEVSTPNTIVIMERVVE